MKKTVQLILMTVISTLLLLACAKETKSIYADLEDTPAEELFEVGEAALANKQYKQAVRQLEALEALYPFSPYAQQAHLDLLYAYYGNEDYVSTAASADRYIRLYPTSEDVDYAYYMKGLANFAEERGVFAKFLPMDLSYRDPGTQAEAFIDFAALVTRYPDSPYAADARQRMVYLRNLQAERELHVAEFYMIRHMYVAAVNRASDVVKFYPNAPPAEQALAILAEANHKLGLYEAADDALEVLELNYPESQSLEPLRSVIAQPLSEIAKNV